MTTPFPGVAARRRVLLVDDHPMMRAGIRQAISIDLHFEVVGEAADAAQALTAALRLRPDLVVMDLELPGGDGFSVMRELQANGLQVPVVILSMHKHERFLNEAISHGASGYVLKDNAATDLLEALRAAVRGELWFSPALSGMLLVRRQRREQLNSREPGLEKLTGTERRILGLVSRNLTTREIASRVGSSPLTIETPRRNICRKLSLEGSHRLLLFALRHASELDEADV